jgi:hypothetical protein
MLPVYCACQLDVANLYGPLRAQRLESPVPGAGWEAGCGHAIHGGEMHRVVLMGTLVRAHLM